MRNHARAAILTMAVLSVTAIANQILFADDPAAMPSGKNNSLPEKNTAELPVKRVVLFSSGVGFFEHSGTVDGDAAAPLKFDANQINDVLKSLVVFDRDGGAVSNVTYPANNPINKILRSFQVDLSGDPPLADIINQMRGSPIELALADDVVKGTLLGVEAKDRPVGKGDSAKVITTWMVNVITPTGIRSVSLDDVRNVHVNDEKIKKEMAAALAAIAQSHDQSKKTVTVNFDGKGKRRVGLGYLVETPIWKATYRLMLPAPNSKDPAKIQGWAIVENQTDNDWNNVDLSLVGGRPLGFIELLYQPLYNPRPVELPQIAGTIHPQTYDDGMNGQGAEAAGNIQPPTFNLSNITAAGTTTGSGGGGGSLFNDTSEPQQQNFASNFNQTMHNYSQGVESIAQTARIGEMFHYNVAKVNLPRQESSMIPIVTDEVGVERLSIYNSTVLQQRALRGLRLTNKTGKYLLGGPVTVMDGAKEGMSYAGDAKIDDLPAGQSRLLSYAVDQEMLVDTSNDGTQSGLVGGSVAKGMLNLQTLNRAVCLYTLDNKGDSQKSVIIEHPITQGYDLKEPAKYQEKTDAVYRFALAVPANSKATLKVVEEQTTMQAVEILKMTDDNVAAYLKEGKIPDKVKTMLQGVIAKRAAVADLDSKMQVKQKDRTRILEELVNARENIKVLPPGSKDQQNAMTDLEARDADLKTVNKDILDLERASESARNDLANYILQTTAE